MASQSSASTSGANNDNNNTQNQSLNQKLAKFCANMSELEKMTAQFSDFYFELMDEPDDRSNVWYKLDANITCSFVNASFFWLYLTLKGTDLQEHPIKEEIGRVRKYMQDYMLLKKDAPQLNVKAARRFIRNALWNPGETNPIPPEPKGGRKNREEDRPGPRRNNFKKRRN